MASNFTIRHCQLKGDMHIKLGGDFDGCSAYELNHCLKKALKRDCRVIVHTDGLTSRPVFGLTMFQKQFGSNPQSAGQVVFTGNFAHEIAPDGYAIRG
jgi:hypothetical protein